MLRNKYTYYIKPAINQVVIEVARRTKISKGKIIEALIKRYLIDNIKILGEEAKYHNDEMIKRHQEIKRLKLMRKEEEEKKLKL